MASDSFQRARAALQPDFVTLFQRLPHVVIDMPGHITLMGDSIESNGSYRLSMGLPEAGAVELALRDDRLVRSAHHYGEWHGVREEYRLGDDTPAAGRLDVVKAVTATLRRKGYDHRGFDVHLVSSLPPTAWVPDSSRVIGVVRALSEALQWNLSDEAIAGIAFQAATECLGESASLARYLAATTADQERTAWLLDMATQDIEAVPLPSTLDWLVIPCNVQPEFIMEWHDQRRRECDAACALLGIRRMRELEGAGRQTVLARLDALPAPLDARARHVVTENERVLTAFALLQQGNKDRLGALLDASHESLRHDFDLAIPQGDALIELSYEEASVYGARLGCGGVEASVILAVEAGARDEVAAHLSERYKASGGAAPRSAAAAA